MGTNEGFLVRCRVVLVVLVMLPVVARAELLLLYSESDAASVLDCNGVADALDEMGLPFATVDLDSTILQSSLLEGRPAAVLCHLSLGIGEGEALADWVSEGGGVLATGQTGIGLESLLGLAQVDLVSGADYTELRFSQTHPVSAGSWWDGPIMQSPPMPAAEVPNIMRYLYIDDTWPGGWPAYAIEPSAASALGHWRDSDAGWLEADGAAAVAVHAHGAGRLVYSGALVGAYANWEWPQTWRTFIVASLHWLADSEPLFEIGLWPRGHRAALTWTGDTEKPAMVTAVPALLNVFAELGLDRFGTFYMVGRAGGDGDTLGALEHPEMVRMIAEAGSQVGGHGDVHTAFRGQPQAQQRQRLQDMVDILDPILAPYGERVRGFRAPYVSQDVNTFPALADVGLDYDAGDIDLWSETTLPHRLGPVWEIPPTMPMDWHLFQEHGLSTEQALLLFQDKFDYVVSRRGLFSWLHHPWVIEPHIDLVRDLLALAVARGDIWLARQDDLLDWWIARQAVSIGAIERQPWRYRLRLDHAGPDALAGVSIWVRLPGSVGADWRVRIDGNLQLADVLEHGGQTFMIVVLAEMSPESSRWIEILTADAVFEDRFEGAGPP